MADSNTFFSNKDYFLKIKSSLKEGGPEKLCVLADFDRTLTYGSNNGKKTPSLVSVLRNNKKYLGEEYSYEAKKLADKYLPIENDLSISAAERRQKMNDWWSKHSQLLIKHRLNKKHLFEIIEERGVVFRDRTKEFFHLLRESSIPLIIISASAVGEDPIKGMIEKEAGIFSNIHIISNSFVYDEDGFAVSYKEPFITINNKDDINIKERDFYGEIEDRDNFILLGDTLDDIKMADNFNYKNIIKVCFLSDLSAVNIEEYKKLYDVIILNDSSMEFVENLLSDIL